MGRILKRVPMDFNWLLDNIWIGYLIKPSYEPPIGEGYQLWETTSKGSPQSPVFSSLEELSEWCSENTTTFGSFKATKEKWKEMLSNNCVYHTSGNVTFI